MHRLKPAAGNDARQSRRWCRPIVSVRDAAALSALALLLFVLARSVAAADVNPYANNRDAAEEGAALYFSSGCAPCHGPQGEGAIGPSLIDDKWLKRFSEGMVFRTIRNGRRGTRMIGFKDRLSEDETWKIVEFLLAKGREQEAATGQ